MTSRVRLSHTTLTKLTTDVKQEHTDAGRRQCNYCSRLITLHQFARTKTKQRRESSAAAPPHRSLMLNCENITQFALLVFPRSGGICEWHLARATPARRRFSLSLASQCNCAAGSSLISWISVEQVNALLMPNDDAICSTFQDSTVTPYIMQQHYFCISDSL